MVGQAHTHRTQYTRTHNKHKYIQKYTEILTGVLMSVELDAGEDL